MRPATLSIPLIALALLLTLAGCHHPTAQTPRWYKGNLHTHSLWSDGDEFPEVIADWYRSHDYQFLAFSDHSVMLAGQRWMKMPEIKKRLAQPALDHYLASWRWKPDTQGDRTKGDFQVRLKTFDELRAKFDKPGRFLLIPSEELSATYNKIPIHINATNLAELIKPINGKTASQVIAANLRAIHEQAQRLNRTILPHINHPNFHYAITAQDLAEIVEERFFEVYNGHPIVNHRGDKTHPSVERIWDLANTLRITRFNAPPLMGLACDDSHNYRRHGLNSAAPGRGWIMVRAPHLTAESLIQAMRAGDFYASSGVSLKHIAYSPKDQTLELEIQPDGPAVFTTQFIGTLRQPDPEQIGPEQIGTVLATTHGLRAKYKLTGNELYVRALVTSSRTAAVPVYAGQLKQAWTQPVGWEKWVGGENPKSQSMTKPEPDGMTNDETRMTNQ